MIDFDEGRQRPTNYIAICDNLADTYPNSIAHGLQKDAIQNAVDARKGRQRVRIHFELLENDKGKFLSITDSNTIGLTGPVLYDSESYKEDLPVDYHWARFESFAFTKTDPDAIGARGQGKFIFLRASSNYTMYYDTLRDDGIYRVGATKATMTECPILPPEDSDPWEGSLGESELHERCGLSPISKVGSRIIIEDPIAEVLEELEDGSFVDAIEETWFRAIEKRTLEVLITNAGKTRTAKLPTPYPLPDEDTEDVKTWILGTDISEDSITVSSQNYRIKNFRAAYHDTRNPIDDSGQGIAIIHNGMKICNIKMSSAPPNVQERLAGFIEFDQKLERELRKGDNQNPNHYNLRWRRALPHQIKSYVQEQLDAFGLSKLGLGTDPREVKKRKRSNAEDWAMRQLLRHAQDLDLFGAKGTVFPRRETPETPPKALGVSINNFSFPDPQIAPRINWGQAFQDITTTAYNRTGDDLEVSVLTQVLHGDSVVVQPIERQDLTLSSGEKVKSNAFDIEILEYEYPAPGMYRISVSLMSIETGDRLDRVTRKFWVEQDPPLRQPFLLQPLPEFF